MDEMVLEVQKWVNETYRDYTGYDVTEENGETGWSTIYALTKGLQAELGITSLANNFGPGTSSAYKDWGEMEIGQVPTSKKGKNIVLILQGAMYCTGYNPFGFTGEFGESTKEAVQELQKNAGLPIQDGKVYDYVFKAFLTMNAYVLTPGGDPKVREIQQDLNNKYFENSGVQPCDGHYQRNTNKALLYGIQTEEGIPASEQTGAIGPTTKSCLPVLGDGSSGRFVKLYRYALYFNGYDSGTFNDVYDSSLREATIQFQIFVGLPGEGKVGKQTWLSTLVSTGDPDRRGTACDGITEVTPARAKTLKNEGYKIIGRYLANVPGGINKKIQPGELEVIFNEGLSVFPIFQLNGGTANDFSFQEGVEAYRQAFETARSYGFKEGTTIYFAVDFDVLGHEITNNILPYFGGIEQERRNSGGYYKIGIYGPRNVCIQVSKKELATTSFVSGMSTGFSANLGYSLPENWAFDQISTITIGSGEGEIEVDNNINSGRDKGASSVEVIKDINDGFYAQLGEISLLSAQYSSGLDEKTVLKANHLTTTYYRANRYDDFRWDILSGKIDRDYVSYVEKAIGNTEFIDVIDPVDKVSLDVRHLMATLSSILYSNFANLDTLINDFSGWGGDLITVMNEVVSERENYTGTLVEKTYKAAYDYIGHPSEGHFDYDDLLADVDALNISIKMKENPLSFIHNIFPEYYKFESRNRFRTFFDLRFNGDEEKLYEDAVEMMTGNGPVISTLRESLQLEGEVAPEYTDEEGIMVAKAFTDKFMYLLSKY